MLQALRSKKVILVIVAVILLLVVLNTSSKDQNAAPTAKATASTTEGAAPLVVTFSGKESSDPDKDALTFAWEFGDGTTSTEESPNKTFEKSGEYSVVLKVSDKKHTITATPIVIKVGAAAVQGTSTDNSTGYTLSTSTNVSNKKKQQFTTATAPLATKPAATFSADKTTIMTGESVVLTWSVTGTAPVCTASDAWSGSVGVSGTQTVSPTATSTYTLTCVNGAGSDTESITVTVTSPVVVNPNLIKNPSFVESYSSEVPLYWTEGSYGTNNATFNYEATGRTDGNSISITMSEYVFGDAKWIFDAVDIVGGNPYEFKDWYKSTVQTEILVDYTLSDSSHEYVLLDPIPAAADWTEFSQTLVAPVNAVKVSIHHMIKADGTLQLDDYSIVAQ